MPLVANSAALKAAGITAATPAPSGGRIENGLFVDNCHRTLLVEDKVPPPTPAESGRGAGQGAGDPARSCLTVRRHGHQHEDWKR